MAAQVMGDRLLVISISATAAAAIAGTLALVELPRILQRIDEWRYQRRRRKRGDLLDLTGRRPR